MIEATEEAKKLDMVLVTMLFLDWREDWDCWIGGWIRVARNKKVILITLSVVDFGYKQQDNTEQESVGDVKRGCN